MTSCRYRNEEKMKKNENGKVKSQVLGRRGTLSSGFTLRRSSLRWTMGVIPQSDLLGYNTKHIENEAEELIAADILSFQEMTGIVLSSGQICRIHNNRRKLVKEAQSMSSRLVSSCRLRLTFYNFFVFCLRSIPATFLLANFGDENMPKSFWQWILNMTSCITIGIVVFVHFFFTWLPLTLYRILTAWTIHLIAEIVCRIFYASFAWGNGSKFINSMVNVQLHLFRRRKANGVSFAYLHLMPYSSTKQHFPTILIRTPYTRWSDAPIGYILARHGYHVIVEDCRGRGDSEGRFDSLNEHKDGISAVEWIVKQPWYESRKGLFLFGISFPGYCALATLHALATSTESKNRDLLRQIRGIAPLYTSSRLPSTAIRDGFLEWDTLLRYCALLFFSGRFGGSRGLPQTLMGILCICRLGIFSNMESPQIKASIRAGPNEASVRHFTKGYDIPMFEDMLKHYPATDQWFVQREASMACTASVPMFFATSWHDIFLRDTIADFQRAEDTNKRAGAKKVLSHRLHIFQGNHMEHSKNILQLLTMALTFFMEAPVRECDETTLSTGTTTNSDDQEDMQVAAHNFNSPATDDTNHNIREDGHAATGFTFDVYNGPSNEPGSRWTNNTQSTSTHLGVDCHATFEQYYLNSGNSLTSNPCIEESRYNYKYNILDPTPSLGGNGLGYATSGRREQRLEVESRNDVVIFTTELLQQTLRIRGSCIVHLCVQSCDQPAALIARLCEYDPSSNTSISICDGIASTAELVSTIKRKRTEASESDGIITKYTSRVTCTPVAIDVPPGRCLRLQVCSGAFPRWKSSVGFHLADSGDKAQFTKHIYASDVICSHDDRSSISIPVFLSNQK